MGLDVHVKTKNNGEVYYCGSSFISEPTSVVTKKDNGGIVITYRGARHAFGDSIENGKHYKGKEAARKLEAVKDNINPEEYVKVMEALKMRGSIFMAWW